MTNPFEDKTKYRWCGEDEQAFYGLAVGDKRIDYSPKEGALAGVKIIAVGLWATNAAVLIFEHFNKQ